MSETRKICYKLRGALIVPLYLIAVFYDQGDVCNPWLILPLGTALFGAGWFLRIYAQMHLHYRLKAHKTLTMTGPYVHVRNPIGNTLILVGINVLSGLLWFVPIMILGCAFTYHMTVLYEEGHLIEKYGESYKAFIASIPRWIPRFSTPNRHPVAPDQVTPEQPVYDTGIHLHGAHFFVHYLSTASLERPRF